jgi:hypothetical protein
VASLVVGEATAPKGLLLDKHEAHNQGYYFVLHLGEGNNEFITSLLTPNSFLVG